MTQGQQHCVKHKWVFNNIEQDSQCCAHLVACGHSQIPGVDCNKNYSPVIHNVTNCILLLLKMVLDLELQIVDVETAFLHEKLEEEICMDFPEGSEDGSPMKCLKLERSIHGLVQGSRMFFKKLILKLKDIGFHQSDADPCSMTWRLEFGPMFVVICVDDCYCVGTGRALDKFEEVMQVQTKMSTLQHHRQVWNK